MASALSEELKQVTSTFKTFTTNQGINTLENNLKEILTDGNVKYFDILIGYFRMSGFNKINDYLDNIDEVKILIGINTENKVFEATELINKFAKEQIEDWEQAVNDDRYKSILSILELLRTDKLKIKVSPNNDNHSKLYILRNKNEFNGRLQGGVIIGSSNLTHNGLSGNFEINGLMKNLSARIITFSYN
jgi:HKD family nuclease